MLYQGILEQNQNVKDLINANITVLQSRISKQKYLLSLQPRLKDGKPKNSESKDEIKKI